jgi:hypothetical protein
LARTKNISRDIQIQGGEFLRELSEIKPSHHTLYKLTIFILVQLRLQPLHILSTTSNILELQHQLLTSRRGARWNFGQDVLDLKSQGSRQIKSSRMSSNSLPQHILPAIANVRSSSIQTFTISLQLMAPTSADPSKPKFTLFPKLPIELRLRIWKESYEPRIIELRTVRFWRSHPSKRYDFVIPKFPAILHANKEAQLESLKDYKMSFKHRQCRRPILFNFSIDTLHIRDYIDNCDNWWQISNTIQILPDRERVQKLSVTFGAF